MRKKKLPPGLYWRGDTLWYRVQAKGREFRGSLRTADVAVATQRLGKVREELTAAAHYGAARLIWEDAVVQFCDEVAPQQIKPGTLKRYLVSFRQVRSWLDGLYVDQIDRKRLSDMVTARRKAGATNATINRDLTAVSAVLSMCVAMEACEENVAQSFPRRQLSRERRDPVTLPPVEHVERVLAEVPGMLADMARASWLTGCRLTELATLTWKQVDLQRRRLTLTTTKTSRARAVPISDAAQDLLSPLPRRLDQPWVFWWADEKGSADRYRSPDSAFGQRARKVAESCAEKGIDHVRFRFHDLRHLFAVTYLRDGGSIYDLQQILGHSSIKTTEIYLSYLTPEEVTAAKAAPASSAMAQIPAQTGTA